MDQIVEIFGVRLQSYMMREYFFIYPLKGHPHIIMGVQWVFELGDIHTNYKKLTMSFNIDVRPKPSKEFDMIAHRFSTKD